MPLSYEEFVHRASQLTSAEPEVLEALYPMVLDMLSMAGRISALIPEYPNEIDAASLSVTATGE